MKRLIPVLAFLCWCFIAQSASASCLVSFPGCVVDTIKTSTPGAMNTVTTDAIDTSTATGILIGQTWDQTDLTSVSDNSTCGFDNRGGQNSAISVFRWTYITNTLSCRKSGHTFTLTKTFGPSDMFGVIVVIAFNTMYSSSAVDGLDHANHADTGTSLAIGSFTPSQDNELVCAGGSVERTDFAAGIPTIDSGMTILRSVGLVSGSNWPLMVACVQQTTAAAINPTFSMASNSFYSLAALALFANQPVTSNGCIAGGLLAAGVGC